jgi:hypothetical protein
MKKSGASQGQSASELISKRIELGDWRGETLSRTRKLISKPNVPYGGRRDVGPAATGRPVDFRR